MISIDNNKQGAFYFFTMTKKTIRKNVLIIHGPNINKTGLRDINQYGKKTFTDLNNDIIHFCENNDVDVQIFQTNNEGAIIDKIQNIDNVDLLVINPGAYAHYSYAIRDAIDDCPVTTIEVHMSNIFGREDFRQKSVIAPVCQGQISGFGTNSYILAIKYIL